MSEGSHLFVQGEKVSYCKTYETHLHSTHILLLFPLQCLVSLSHRMCYERTCWLQLQGRYQRYSIFTSEPTLRTRLYIQWTESIHTNPCCKAKGLLDTVSPSLACQQWQSISMKKRISLVTAQNQPTIQSYLPQSEMHDCGHF